MNVDGDAVKLAMNGVTTSHHTSFVKPADPQPLRQVHNTGSQLHRLPWPPIKSAPSTEDDNTPIALRLHPRAAKEASPYGH